MNQIFNHLWQSTVFAGAVAVACLALRRNSPRLRYWLWLTASSKFLIPFSLLVSMGSWIEVPPDTPSLHATTVQEISTYFAPVSASPPAPAHETFDWPLVLGAIWLGGALFLLLRWIWRWNRIRLAAVSATPLPLGDSPLVFSSVMTMEPGVFGIVRPVILLPDGLSDNLTPEQMTTILAHELRHIRCWDNLTAALHMCVEALFWFHPIVWWIGARLIDERERDCDEAVLRLGNSPGDYARSILHVCETYVNLPLACASGISGADLKNRIREIMTWRGSAPITSYGKVTLAAIALVALSAPFLIGVIRAQTLPPPPAYSYDVVSIHRSAPDAVRFQWGTGPQGGLRTINTTTEQLLELAYQIPEYRLQGLPKWATSEHYDITFTPAEHEAAGVDIANATEMARRNRNWQRLQGVLRDRFHLVLREETHQSPLYGMVQDRNGAKLSHTDDKNSSFMIDRPGHLVATAQLIGRLAPFLEVELGRPVVDQTGLKGLFSFTLEWDPNFESTDAKPSDSSSASVIGLSLVAALRQQLGLRLESKKGPVPVYVIEKIERPTEN